MWNVTVGETQENEASDVTFIKNNARAKNAIFACITKDVFDRLDASATSRGIW